LIQLIVRDVGSLELFIESQMPEHFILRKVQGKPYFKKLVSEAPLPPSRILAHQDMTPDRLDVLAVGLFMAAIAARMDAPSKFARSLLLLCSAAALIIRDVKRLRPCALANCYRVPKSDLDSQIIRFSKQAHFSTFGMRHHYQRFNMGTAR